MSYENAQRLYDRQLPADDPYADEIDRELWEFERAAMRGDSTWIEYLDENETSETLAALWEALRANATRPAPQRFVGWLRRVFLGDISDEVAFAAKANAVFMQAFGAAERWHEKMERERLERGFP